MNTEKLDKIRDELAEKYADKWWPIEFDLEYEEEGTNTRKDVMLDFKAGWSASTEHWRKIVEGLVKALEFYGDADSWGHISKDVAQYVVIQDDEGNGDFQFNDITDDFRVGGLRARQAIAEYRKMIGGADE